MSFFNWVCLEDLYPGPLSAGQLESVVGVGGEDLGGFSGSWGLGLVSWGQRCVLLVSGGGSIWCPQPPDPKAEAAATSLPSTSS